MAEKQKLLIVNSNMHIGGVQKALSNLLWYISKEYDVSLLLFYKGGGYLEQLPDNVKVLTVKSHFKYLGMTKNDVHGVKDKLLRTIYAAICRIFGRRYAVSLMSLGQKKLNGYDCAISFLHNPGDNAFFGGCNDFVLKHIEARKKVAFLHCDYLLSGANTERNAHQYKRFDAIAACSEGCAKSFLTANPDLSDRLRTVKNCHRYDEIIELAKKDPISLKEDKLNIVTVSRLGREKSIERALHAIAKLGKNKEKIHYYIVGDGVTREELHSLIEREKLHDIVTMCGEKANPYGYVKAADILLIPSLSEAAPMVIGEAACLGTPVLSTETSSAKEMVEECGIGWVCENSIDGIYNELKSVIEDTSALEEKKLYLSSLVFADCCAVEEFKNLVEKFPVK